MASHHCHNCQHQYQEDVADCEGVVDGVVDCDFMLQHRLQRDDVGLYLVLQAVNLPDYCQGPKSVSDMHMQM